MIIKRNKEVKIEQKKELQPQKKQTQVEEKEEVPQVLAEEGLNIENEEIALREERRRGNRRRGYRRIDDRKLVSRAQEEASQIKQKALIDGFHQGIELAQEEIKKITENLKDITNIKSIVYQELSNDILDIAIEIAKKIIKQEINTDKNILINMIVSALTENTKNESKIVIKVSNDDYDFIKESSDSISEQSQLKGKIQVLNDNNLTQGNVIIETTSGVMDISFETQLKVLQEMFKTIG